MKHLDILKKIGVILNELQDQYEFFEKNKNNINDLELELFIANANFLKEHTEILRKLNEQNIQPDKTLIKTPTEKYFEPVVYKAAPLPVVDKKESVSKEDSIDHNFDAPAKETTPSNTADEPIIRHQLNLDIDTDIPEHEQLLEEHNEITDVTPSDTSQPVPAEMAITIPIEPELPTIYEPATEKPLTLNQVISAQMGSSSRLADNIELQPIKDLKAAINLNDKMLFVKDLFHGYSMAYSEAIEILNRFNKLEEADQFLKLNYVTKNNWAAKQATADKFYSLLKRRFA